MKPELTQAEVKSIFDYSDGYLYWKIQKGKRVKIGDIAGSASSRGYFLVQVNGNKYLLHRLIFLWHNGFVPTVVDHEDNDTGNNRIENLRAATLQQNSFNKPKKTGTTSKYIGVWLTPGNKWMAYISINRKRKHLGLFSTEIEAAMAYNNEVVKYRGEFAKRNQL